MDKADFYVGIGPSAEWLGSVSKCGELWAISTPILLQVNQTMYEEMVIEYIKYCEGVVANHVCQWPWEWFDSRMTDYSYTFIPEHHRVYMSMMGEDLLDPLKILQGESVTDSLILDIGYPDFPVMIDKINFEDVDKYGLESPSLI
jgi:hypothetical protein